MEIDKIYNEDCLIGMAKMPDNSADAVVTSPPYNYCLRIHGDKYTRRSSSETRSGLVVNKYTTNDFTDALDMKDYFEWQCKCIDEMLRISRGVVFYNIQIITGNKPAVFQILGKYSERIRELLIWDKKNAEPAIMSNCLNSEFELIVAFEKGDCKGRMFKTMNAERGTLSNVIRIGKNRENEHRAAFPVELPRHLIANFTPPNGLILDPFMGSGTTAVAAIKESRHFVGFELDKGYYDKALQRIKNEQAQPSLF